MAKPPYPLHGSSTKPSFSEGFESVVQLLKGKKHVVVLTGAGMSVSCGIPDFRSRGSGLYATMDAQEFGLSCAEELFDLEVFSEFPQGFFRFAKNLYFPLGNNETVRPSDSHKLLAMLEEKKMLLRVYTQNIDGLEELAGVSPKKIVYAHGNLRIVTCTKCKRKFSSDSIRDHILNGTVPLCQEAVSPNGNLRALTSASRELSARSGNRKRQRTEETNDLCLGVLKPSVTFFGEALHDNVRRALEADRNKVDALIVIGTSLSVAPISKVIAYLPPNIPRILINRTIVHPAKLKEDNDDEYHEEDLREDYVFDAYLLGFCDDVTRALAKKLFSDRHENNAADGGKLLACLGDEDEYYDKDDWSAVHIPTGRVFLFAGAQPPTDDDASVLSYREIAHCDGCSERIVGTIQKCVTCFDYDLCQKCYPKLSKAHCAGKHHFAEETACPLFENQPCER